MVSNMNLSCGVDLIEVDRVAAVVARWGDRFLTRIFTAGEIAYCRGQVPELAVRFAAKEATSKALGTGIAGISWREMEVVPDRRGKPTMVLHGKAPPAQPRLAYTALKCRCRIRAS